MRSPVWFVPLLRLSLRFLFLSLIMLGMMVAAKH